MHDLLLGSRGLLHHPAYCADQHGSQLLGSLDVRVMSDRRGDKKNADGRAGISLAETLCEICFAS